MKSKRVSTIFTIRCLVMLAIGVALFLSALSASCDENDTSDKYSVIRYIVESVGEGCTGGRSRQLGITKSQCDVRHLSAVAICSEITLDNSPEQLDYRGRLKVTLVFSLCRGVIMQEAPFEIDKWESTITMLLDQTPLATREVN